IIRVAGRVRGGRARSTATTNESSRVPENSLTSSNALSLRSGRNPSRAAETRTSRHLAARTSSRRLRPVEDVCADHSIAVGRKAPDTGAAFPALEPELPSSPSVLSCDAGSPGRPCHPNPQDQEPSHPSEDPEDPGAMIDASEFRAGVGDGYHPSGRMSPGGSFASNASSYATLTPLQPLPPISTMSDKFSHYGHPHPNAGFSSLMPAMGMGGYPMGGYDKLGPMGGINVGSVSPPGGHGQAAPMLGHHANATIPSPPYSQNGAGAASSGMVSPQLTDNKGLSSYESYSHASRELARLGSPQSPPGSSVALHSPTMLAGLNGLGSLNGLSAHTPPSANLAAPATPPQQDVKPFTAASITSAAGSSTPPSSLPRSMGQTTSGLSKQSHSTSSSAASSADEVEEINTKELAQRISAELKRYSIPQAIFAQRVLCRSQGTLSDLLRNPKPWSKLKSGRETFRRMYKWLEEPEFQRMSALRLAVPFPLDFVDNAAKSLPYFCL
ncbi:one cut domain family member 2-like, partial [Tropilaelaps mercedesae]